MPSAMLLRATDRLLSSARSPSWRNTATAITEASTAAAATPVAAPSKTTAKPATKPAPRPASKPTPATTRQQANSTAKGLALATQTTEAISAGQLDVAARVLTGAADCEFNQRITVQTLNGQPGLFTVSHQGRHYRMLPRETTTGAVRPSPNSPNS